MCLQVHNRYKVAQWLPGIVMEYRGDLDALGTPATFDQWLADHRDLGSGFNVTE